MATKLDIGDKFTRKDYWFVDPFKVIVREDLRGRHKPPTDDKIITMALSLMANGQRQPIEGRKVENDKVMVNSGFTRTAAARLIRDGFTDPDNPEAGLIQDKEFQLKVIVVSNMNDKQAFIHNIVENAHRNETSPIDDAYNHEKLRDQYGYTDAQIKKLYLYKDDAKVGRLRRLLSLNDDLQNMIHDGQMSVATANELLDLPQDKRDEAIARSTNTKGKVVAAKMREQVRAHILRDEDDETTNDAPIPSANGTPAARGVKPANGTPSANGTPAKQKSKPLTAKEVREGIEPLMTHVDEAVQAFAKVMNAWVKGRKTRKAFHNAVEKLLDAERV